MDTAQPVTVIITRRVRPGCEQTCEVWLDGFQSEVSSLSGYLGLMV